MSTVPSNLVPTPISQLPTIPTAPTAADQLMIVQNGNTYRAALGQISSAVGVPSTRMVNTGTGLAGGGQLSSDLTLYMANTGVTAGSYGGANIIPTFSVNAQGQLTSVSTAAISVAFNDITGKPTTLAGYGITDAQPLNANLTALAGMGTTGFISATSFGNVAPRTLLEGNGISITNPTGAGGDPTISLTNTPVTPGTYGSSSTTAVITVDQQGRITAIGSNSVVGSGTVTSVGMTMPADFVVSGSPVTTSGTLAVTYNSQAANKVLAGPTTGPDIQPSFRSLVNADLPDSGASAGSYGSSTTVPVLTVNSKGVITSASTTPIIGGLNYQGGWNASTNTPTLTSSVGTNGYYYAVTVAGTTNLNGITDWQIGDWAIYNGSVWQKIDQTNTVTSVNGQVGAVVLTASDVGAASSSITISAGTGLTGGGDLTANRTLSIANTGVTASTYGSASSVPVVAVNAQGQITSATNTSISIDTSQIGTGILPIARGGTNATATPTAGAIAYGTGSAYAFTAAGTAGQFLQSTGSGTPTWSTPSSGSFQPAYYGTFVSTSSQANGGATTANAVNFDTTALSNGISITSSDRITFANAGIYLIAFELAVNNSTGANATINAWLAQNGTNIANTNSDLTILGGANQPQILEQQWIVNVAAGDYVQIYWSSSATTIGLLYQASAASPTRPASPSAIVNVAFIPPSGTNLVVNSSTLTGGTSGYILYDNAGTVGEKATTGSGDVVLATSPTLVTPNLGTPSAATLTNATGLPISTGVSGLGTGVATALGNTLNALNGLVGYSGALGTPTSGTLTNATGLPISTGVSGLGTSVATALGVAVGTAGSFVVNGGALGTPSSGTLTNATGLPLSTGVTGTLAIANGGTGQTTASAAFDALSPITSTGDLILGNGVNSATRLPIGTNGYVLTSNGTTATWSASTGGVSSFSAGTTGLTPSSGTTGAITLAGTLNVANGGTGATTVAGAQTNLQVDPAGTALAYAVALG